MAFRLENAAKVNVNGHQQTVRAFQPMGLTQLLGNGVTVLRMADQLLGRTKTQLLSPLFDANLRAQIGANAVPQEAQKKIDSLVEVLEQTGFNFERREILLNLQQKKVEQLSPLEAQDSYLVKFRTGRVSTNLEIAQVLDSRLGDFSQVAMPFDLFYAYGNPLCGGTDVNGYLMNSSVGGRSAHLMAYVKCLHEARNVRDWDHGCDTDYYAYFLLAAAEEIADFKIEADFDSQLLDINHTPSAGGREGAFQSMEVGERMITIMRRKKLLQQTFKKEGISLAGLFNRLNTLYVQAQARSIRRDHEAMIAKAFEDTLRDAGLLKRVGLG